MPLHMFAADLHEVVMAQGRRAEYEDPAAFFGFTCPTYNLRELVKDVLGRLEGLHDKTVQQLELNYGGGKTHALITLFHLVQNPGALPNLPAVEEFTAHAGLRPPRARVSALCFDKLDTERGMQVKAPHGQTRWLREPWSVLAYQLAGDEGLKLLAASGQAEERQSAPAQNLLAALLALPQREQMATLVLLDEVLMYAREKVALDASWQGRLKHFFQCLTQAATSVDRCCVVASLLAADPAKSDDLGKQIIHDLYGVFRRQREQLVVPVAKQDVAEVLRRRFFEPESIADRSAFRPHVLAALAGTKVLDEQTAADPTGAEQRLLDSYPFHPDLTDVLYTKWTNLEGFQRTRGVLRTFALALRYAMKWDTAPLIGPAVFLAEPNVSGLSEALTELAHTAGSEHYEGRTQKWSPILESELEKTASIQLRFAALKARELEQAVVATFLHSQPVGHKALTRDLMVLVGHTRPDRIELENGLRFWARRSHWLDDAFLAGPPEALPAAWRLGNRPNLNQMHAELCTRISDELVEQHLRDRITQCKSLTNGAFRRSGDVSVHVHNLPESPRQVEDDGEFHFAVLGPPAACVPGRPSGEARRFMDETTGPDRPRVYRNALILAVPSPEGLEAARARVRQWIGWQQLGEKLSEQQIDSNRAASLRTNTDSARHQVERAVRQSYCVAVAVAPNNDVDAWHITVDGGAGDSLGLFDLLAADPRLRIGKTAISADALLPGGPYELWRRDQTSRRLRDLVGAFAQLPRLPKMLNRWSILETLIEGCEFGLFVFQLRHDDESFSTWWRMRPPDHVLSTPGLELILPQAASLADVDPALLAPDQLPGLWEGPQLAVRDLHAYFGGGRVVTVPQEDYDEQLIVPRAEPAALNRAVASAVERGLLWLASNDISACGEPIDSDRIKDEAILRPPPPALAPTEVLPDSIPTAWRNGITTAAEISLALDTKTGESLPWGLVRDTLTRALGARLIEPDNDGAADRAGTATSWPCAAADAPQVQLRAPQQHRVQRAPAPPGPGPAPAPAPGAAGVELQAAQIQDLGETIHEIARAGAALGLHYYLSVEVTNTDAIHGEAVRQVNELLARIESDLKLVESAKNETSMESSARGSENL